MVRQEKTIKLKDLADEIGGRIDGDGAVVITGVANIQKANDGDITFAINLKYLDDAINSKASAIIVPEDFPPLDKTVVRHANSYLGWARTLRMFCSGVKELIGKHPSAVTGDDSIVGDRVYFGPNVVIGARCVIGDDVKLYPGTVLGNDVTVNPGTILYANVTAYDDVCIGRNVIIHSGTILGADGYGFAQDRGQLHKIPQIGSVIIEDDVEIGANVTIDRATVDATIIGAGTKIDNLVHIAHNCKIGKNVIIVAQVGVSGSVEVGDNVLLAGQVGIVGHVKIGAGSKVAARSVVTKDVAPGSFVSGFPAKPHSEETRIMAATRKLPEMVKYFGKMKKNNSNGENPSPRKE